MRRICPQSLSSISQWQIGIRAQFINFAIRLSGVRRSASVAMAINPHEDSHQEPQQEPHQSHIRSHDTAAVPYPIVRRLEIVTVQVMGVDQTTRHCSLADASLPGHAPPQGRGSMKLM